MIQAKDSSTPPPLVSIIIPVYNVEQYLEECIESACNQTLKDIEIICVDDGSTDRSREIITSYVERDSRVCLIDSRHGGASSARNLGIEHARGKYIQFLDSDDYIAPTMSSTMYSIMSTYNVDVVMCGITVFYEEGQEYRDKEEIERYYKKEKEGLYTIDITSISYALASVCVKMIKKSVLDTYNIRFLENRTYEDNYFTLAYLTVVDSIYFLKEALYYRRLRNESITDLSLRGYSDSRIDLFYQLEHLFYFWVKHNRLSFDYVAYFWNFYIVSLYDTLENYPHISSDKLRHIVKRFVHKTKQSIPRIPEFYDLRVYLSRFVGYDV